MSARRRRAAVAFVGVAAVLLGVSVGQHGSAAAHATADGGRSAPHTSSGYANRGVRLRDAHGIHVQQVVKVGHRQLQARIVPAALQRAIGVRIILPVGYRAAENARYPSLYLFPGTSGHSDDWATAGHAVKTTKPYGLITIDSDVGIDGDGGSWFTNWVDTKTDLGPSRWEDYDIHELIPWIDANFKTRPTRGQRAVAGLSMGGYGAIELAARHPDRFTMAASFSGAPEIDRSVDARIGATAIISATMVGLDGVEPDAPFGSHLDDEINWRGHDPARLIDNLRGVKLWLATGDGRPGPYDDPVTDPGGAVSGGVIESLARVSTDHFHRRLVRQNIPSHYWYYGNGTHSFPYWARDLRAVIAPMMRRFAHPVGPRRHVHYTSIQSSWNVFGWHARFRRAHRLQFSNLTHASRHGFWLYGSGIARVLTPRRYRPDAAYQVRVGGHRPRTLHANRHGQLRVVLRYGDRPHRQTVRISG